MRVQEIIFEKLQDNEETDKDHIVNATFQSVVEEQSRYCHGVGAGIQPTKGKSITGLCEQLQEERNIREEMAAHLEESQMTFEERLEKQIEEKMTYIFKNAYCFGWIIFPDNG
ncbi:hypothetical protein AAZX31_13G070400 [Glycine max]